MLELKNKCDTIEKKEAEKRQLEEKKHQEELSSLKKTNQQLKVSLSVGKTLPLAPSLTSHPPPHHHRHSWKDSLHHKRSSSV